MKKLTAIMALLLCSGLAQARTYDEIISSKTIRIGVPADYAPLAFYDNQDSLVGFDIDMAKDLAKKLNVTPEFYITSWPTLSQDLAADKYDVAMGGVTYTKDRAAKFLLSDQVVPNGKIALAACDMAPQLANLDAINQPNVKVVVNPGGTNESFVNQNIHTAHIIRVKNNIDNLQALRDKTADMMVTDLIEGHYYENKEPNVLCLATVKPFEGTESYKAYMVQLNNKKLMDEINNWLPNSNKEQLAIKWGVITHLN